MSKKLSNLAFILIVLLSACGPPGGGDGPIINLPPAETPIIETILDIDHDLLAPYHAAGVFEMQPGKRLELRLRVVWPSNIQVMVENQTLPEVKDSHTHPELDSSGYYRLVEQYPIGIGDPRFFWRVFVVLPLDKRGNVNYTMTLRNISQNPDLSGTEKELKIIVFRTPVLAPRPSSLFQCYPNVNKDCKHAKVDGTPFCVPEAKQVGPVIVLIPKCDAYEGAWSADNVTLAGWLVGDEARHQEYEGETEDWHYHLWLDNDFIERNYTASSPELATAIMPGRWITWGDDKLHPRMKIPLTGGKQPNASTFLMPGTPDVFIVELNAWHASYHNGQVPNGWVADPEPTTWPDVFWPFNPVKIHPGEPDLMAGDYVIITGAFIEDSAHLHDLPDPNHPEDTVWHNRRQCWDDKYKGQGGWLEIHPVDSIRRVEAPTVRKHAQLLQVCNNGDTKTPNGLYNHYLSPLPPDKDLVNPVLKFREIIDDRFTNMSTIAQHTVEISGDKLRVTATVKSGGGQFKAVYLLWWEGGLATPTPEPTPIPSDKMQSGDTLLAGDSRTSANGIYTLVFESDGNLVLYRNQGSFKLWVSNTSGGSVGSCTFYDGKLSIADPFGNTIWESSTSGSGFDSVLVVQDNGNVVISRPDGTLVWATDTAQKP